MNHKDHLRSRGRGFSQRDVNIRETRQRFLIVCEGEKTEPEYFARFRCSKVVIDIRGTGYNTVSLVREAIDRKAQGNYDQIWCVFDRDSFCPEHINEAFQLARNNKIQLAYSNEAFELWYILHFQYLESALTRQDYVERLSILLGHPYEKNSESLFDELFNLQAVAVQHARRLHQIHVPFNPCTANPSTTVYLLVEELNRFGENWLTKGRKKSNTRAGK